MLRRPLFAAGATMVALVVLVGGVLGWLLYTEAGARWAVGKAVAATGGALVIDELSGSLGAGVSLGSVGYETENLNVAADVEAAVDIDLVPLGVAIDAPRISGIVVDIRLDDQDSAESAAVDVTALLESLALPVALRVNELEVRDISFNIDGKEVVAFDRLGLSAYWYDRIELSALELSSSAIESTLDAELGLARPFSLSLEARADALPELTRLPERIDVSVRLLGDLDRIEVALKEQVNSVEITGQFFDVLNDQRRWDVAATAAALELPGDAGARLEDVVLRSSGWLDEYTLVSRLGLVVDERVDVEVNAGGSLSGVDIVSLNARHAAGELGTSGRLDFPFDFNGQIRIADAKPSRLSGALSPELILSAGADVRASASRVEIANGRINAGGASARFVGVVDLEREQLAVELVWQNLHWPLGTDTPDIVSPEGEATIDGSFAEWTADANAVLEPKGLPSGRFRVAAAGSNDRANVDIVDGDVLGGSLDGVAAITWGDDPSWSANIDAEGIETGVLVAAFPGSITLSVSARSLDDMGSARIEVAELKGSLLNERIAGSGALNVSADSLAADRLQLVHGSSMVELDGELRSADGLRFAVDIDEISDYTTGLSGDFNARGSIGMPPGSIALNMNAGSESLRYGDFAFDRLRVEARHDGEDTQRIAANIFDVKHGERQLGDVDLDSVLSPDIQVVGLAIRPLGYTLQVGLTGKFDNWDDIGSSPWRGSLDEFTLRTPDNVEARLADAAPLVLSRNEVDIGRFCVGSQAGNSLCSAFGWSNAGLISVSAEATALPIAVLDAIVQTGFRFEQELSGTVRWRRAAGQLPTGGADLRFTGGEVESDDFPELDLRTDPGVFAFEVEDGKLLSGELDLPMPGKGYVKGDFLLSDVNLGLASPVQGALAAEISDIDVLASLLPDIDDAAGVIEANLTLEGTVAEPVFLGDAALIGATLTYFPLGLVLEEIDLEGKIDATQRIDLNGRFRAGQGVAEVRSSRDSSEDSEAGLHFEIRGDNLSVINLPDVTAMANADLSLDFRGGRLDLAGRVDIPYARILPRNLVVAPITESADVVIIEGGLPDAPDVEEEPVDLEVFGQLSLGIGDDVEVRLDVARAELSGNADFEWSGDLIPVGNGRYDIVGTVQAFGQVLNISEGGVRFPNVPADDPLIRIRATREIYGNSEVKRAGILVDGSVTRPTIEAYTVPLTTEERALALLLTGNDFNLEQGVGAIDFGTYIAPRLFLSYGVGVFARENIISARYDLKRGFGVRVSSGSKDSGVDMTYRIEN